MPYLVTKLLNILLFGYSLWIVRLNSMDLSYFYKSTTISMPMKEKPICNVINENSKKHGPTE